MERLFLTLFLISSLMFPCIQAKGAARSFSTTGTLGGGEEVPNWFYQIKPLPQTPQKKAQQASQQKKPAEKAVVNVPPAPAPKSRIAKDTRKIYDSKPADTRKVTEKTERDKPPTVQPKKSVTRFDLAGRDPIQRDPRFRNQSRLNEPGVFQPIPSKHPRRHAIADWP